MTFEEWYDKERAKSVHYQDTDYSILQRYIANPGIRKAVAQYMWTEVSREVIANLGEVAMKRGQKCRL